VSDVSSRRIADVAAAALDASICAEAVRKLGERFRMAGQRESFRVFSLREAIDLEIWGWP
jgi:hypothetical protein